MVRKPSQIVRTLALLPISPIIHRALTMNWINHNFFDREFFYWRKGQIVDIFHHCKISNESILQNNRVSISMEVKILKSVSPIFLRKVMDEGNMDGGPLDQALSSHGCISTLGGKYWTKSNGEGTRKGPGVLRGSWDQEQLTRTNKIATTASHQDAVNRKCKRQVEGRSFVVAELKEGLCFG